MWWLRQSRDLGFISRFNDTMLSLVGDVPIDSEASVVTSSISKLAGSTRFFGGAHRSRGVYTCVHRGVFMFVSVCICDWISQKKTKTLNSFFFSIKIYVNITLCDLRSCLFFWISCGPVDEDVPGDQPNNGPSKLQPFIVYIARTKGLFGMAPTPHRAAPLQKSS